MPKAFAVHLDYEMLTGQAGTSGSDVNTPEKRLMVAIIHRAVLDFYGHDAHPHHRIEAGRWIFGDSTGFMSLYWVCHWLSDDPKWLQKSIQQMLKRGERPNGPIMRVDR